MKFFSIVEDLLPPYQFSSITRELHACELGFAQGHASFGLSGRWRHDGTGEAIDGNALSLFSNGTVLHVIQCCHLDFYSMLRNPDAGCQSVPTVCTFQRILNPEFER